MVKEVILTREGYEKLKQEIEHLSTEKRREVADRIRIAREFGDITENSEYDDAKNEQALLEHRIATLEERLLSARVIEKKDIAKDVVSVGSKVKLRDIGGEQDVRVPDRRLRGGEPGRAEALERVAGRQGDHRQEEGRGRRGRGPARRAQVQDPGHQGRVAPSRDFKKTGGKPPAGLRLGER